MSHTILESLNEAKRRGLWTPVERIDDEITRESLISKARWN